MPDGIVFPVGALSSATPQVSQGMTDSEYMYELARAYQNSSIPEFVAHANRITAIRHKIEQMERTHFSPQMGRLPKYGASKR